jgi:hypothetical protein
MTVRDPAREPRLRARQATSAVGRRSLMLVAVRHRALLVVADVLVVAGIRDV